MGLCSTKVAAQRIVSKLRQSLNTTSRQQLSSVRSVFLSGSYLRGDWLELNSDLDVGVLHHEDSAPGRRLDDLRYLKSMVGDDAFASHTPGGIDWNIQVTLPTDQDKSAVGPYLPYNVFLFDLTLNICILWGDDFVTALPTPADPKGLSLAAMSYLALRAESLEDSLGARRKVAFSSFKTAQILQIYFGERTLDKVKLLELYRIHVPDFNLKPVGELIILDYYCSTYPESAPAYRDVSWYRAFIEASHKLLVASSADLGRT